MEQLLDWAYGQIVGLLGTLFEQIGNMGVELFEMPWVQSIVLFFTQLAWALYVVGLIVAAFDVAVAYERGQGDIKQTAMNALKGFMAVSLFSVVPVELYKLSVSLQSSLSAGIIHIINCSIEIRWVCNKAYAICPSIYLSQGIIFIIYIA